MPRTAAIDRSIDVGTRVYIDGHNPTCHGTVKALSVRGWPEGWTLVEMDGHLSDTVAPHNRLRRVVADQ